MKHYACFSFEEVKNGIPTVIGLIPLIWNIIKLVAIGSIILFLSAAIYMVFYYAAMPPRAATEALYFDYTQPAELAFPSMQSTHTSCAHPLASIDLFASHDSWEAIATNDILPPPKAKEQLLVSGRAYYIETLLELPDTPLNRLSGMFGVVTELYASNGTMLAVSRRSARYPYSSPWIETLNKLLRIGGILLGAMKESKTITVSSFSHFVESPALPLVRASSRMT